MLNVYIVPEICFVPQCPAGTDIYSFETSPYIEYGFTSRLFRSFVGKINFKIRKIE